MIGLNLSGARTSGPARAAATQLLDAAIDVIRRDGARALTLDAVAAEAGVSKGGLLYHFASKRALIDGLLERWLDDFEAGFGAGRLRRRLRARLRPARRRARARPRRSSACSPR